MVLAISTEVHIMTAYVVNESEHRRGLVLGLTLAEILLLLLFLLLLALGSQIRKEQSRYAELRPLLKTSTVQELAANLNRLPGLEEQVRKLQMSNADLEQKLSVLDDLGPNATQMVKDFKESLILAAPIDPDDPPSVLRRALRLIQLTAKSNLDISQHSTLLENTIQRAAGVDPENPPAVLEKAMNTFEQLGSLFKPEELDSIPKTIAGLHEKTERYRRERDNLMRSGRGLVFPSCWTSDSGDTEYIFDVTIRDSGVLVKDSGPAYRKAHESWKFVDEFAREMEIPETKFRNATARLYNWSRQHDCRFVVTMRDQTEPTSKDRYKALRSLVEQHFYVRSLDASAPTSNPRARPPSTREQSPIVEGGAPTRGDTRQMGGPFVPVPR
jgi:hypothetical protein